MSLPLPLKIKKARLMNIEVQLSDYKEVRFLQSCVLSL